MYNKPMKKLFRMFWIILTILLFPIVSRIAKNRDRGQKRILIIPQLGRIGDIICSTPVLYNIKKIFPNAHITVLISKKAVGILKNNPRIDEIILVENYTFLTLIRKIQNERFNWSLNLSATSKNTCLVVLGLIPHRVKTIVETPPITERLTDWMSNHRLLYKNHTFLPQHHINLLKFMGINNPELTIEIGLDPKAEIKAEEFINGRKIVGISISAGNTIKEWGDENFKEITKKILKQGIPVAIIGSNDDKKRIDAFVQSINTPLCFSAINFNLEELPSLIKRLSLYIAVDTGPIYIAYTLKTPLIDITGPVDPKEQPPRDERSLQVLPRGHILPSSFVFKKRGTQKQIREAIESTHVDDVMSAVEKLKIFS